LIVSSSCYSVTEVILWTLTTDRHDLFFPLSITICHSILTRNFKLIVWKLTTTSAIFPHLFNFPVLVDPFYPYHLTWINIGNMYSDAMFDLKRIAKCYCNSKTTSLVKSVPSEPLFKFSHSWTRLGMSSPCWYVVYLYNGQFYLFILNM